MTRYHSFRAPTASADRLAAKARECREYASDMAIQGRFGDALAAIEAAEALEREARTREGR